jgi:hypothetical protein
MIGALIRFALAKSRQSGKRMNVMVNGDPGGNRTRDNLIKSQVLYRLSYRIIYA